MLNSFCIVSDIQEISVNTVTKYIYTPDDDSNAIILYTYIYFLERIGKFKDLTVFLKNWMDLDPKNWIYYQDWLMESFGHTDPKILSEVICSIFVN